MLSAAPLSCAASSTGRSRGGFGSRTRAPLTPAASGPRPTVTSSRSAIARRVAAVARLKISVGEYSWAISALHQGRVDAGFRQFGAEATLVIFGNRRPLHLVAFVEKGKPKAEGQISKNLCILSPGHDRARRHHGRNVAVDEPGAGQIGERHHRA